MAAEAFKKFIDVIAGLPKVQKLIESIKSIDLSEIGKNILDGLANGLKAGITSIPQILIEVGTKLVEAIKNVLGIHSPSRVFYGIGDYAGQGFVNALHDYGTKAYAVGNEMADSATNGISGAISKIQSIIDGDIDVQPTIRPVLDLSNVQSGVGVINGMFSDRMTVRAMSDLSSINSMMNNGIQNGGNTELVSAIDKLNNSLDNLGNTTYTVNGITYDDGSNISDAIQSLVRAARIERRI